MPIFYFISFIFNMIATIFKFYSINKNITEYLFINLKQRSIDKKIKELKKMNQRSHNALDFIINTNTNNNNNNIRGKKLSNNFQSNSYKKVNKFIFNTNENNNMKKNIDNTNKDYFSSKKNKRKIGMFNKR